MSIQAGSSFLNLSNNDFFTDLSGGFRPAVVRQLERVGTCDVVVLGGGALGSAFAWQSAFNGLKTVLLEEADYGQDGGADFCLLSQELLTRPCRNQIASFLSIKDGIRRLLGDSSNLLQPCQTVVAIGPIEKSFEIGERLLAAFKVHLHKRLLRDGLVPGARGIFGQHRFPSKIGVIRDFWLSKCLFCQEMIYAARQEGACCLNYAQFLGSEIDSGKRYQILWRDQLEAKEYRLNAAVVVDCRGSASINHKTYCLLGQSSRFAALILDLHGYDSCAVFVRAGETIVQLQNLRSKWPTDNVQLAELEHLIPALRQILPGFVFGFERSLQPLRVDKQGQKLGALPTIQRTWSFQNGVFLAPATSIFLAQDCAFRGLRRLMALAGYSQKIRPISLRPLPRQGLCKESLERFFQIGRAKGVPEDILKNASDRLGSRVRFIGENEEAWQIIAGAVLAGEIAVAQAIHQAVTFDDLIKRRLLWDLQSIDHAEKIAGIRDFCLQRYPDLVGVRLYS